MMELLPLPHFYHWVYLVLIGVAVTGIGLWWVRGKKPKPKPTVEEMIQAIQRLAPKDPKTKELLAKLIPYRYDPKAGPIPKAILKELKNYHDNLQKKYRLHTLNKSANCSYYEKAKKHKRKRPLG